MKKFLRMFLSVIMLFCFGGGLAACRGAESSEHEKSLDALGAPTLTVTGVTLNWTAVENATGYVLKIDGSETAVNGTTYSLDNLTEGEYLCAVKAKGDGVSYKDGEYSNQVTVVYESDAPVITVESNSIMVDKNFSVVLNEVNLGLSILDSNEYTFSYEVKENGLSPVTLNNDSFTVGEEGFYTVDITATDIYGAKAVKRVNIVVRGTYLYSLDEVRGIDYPSVDWFVRNSSKGESTPAEVIKETNGNQYYKLTATAGETTTFNMPLPTQNGVSVTVGASYKAYITLWTDAGLIGEETVAFTSVSPMTLAKGQLDKDKQAVVLTAFFSAMEERISTFYITNNSDRNISYYLDNLVLVETPAWDEMPVDIGLGTDEIDENGNLKSVFDRADSNFVFYPKALQNCAKGTKVKVTLQYKIVSDRAMEDSRGALGSYNGGTLFLTANSEDFLTESFETIVDEDVDGAPCLKITFITVAGATMYISELATEMMPEWSVMPVDVERGTDEVDENGNFKSTFSRADALFGFYPEVIQNCTAGDKVKVTLKYQIISEAPMADSRGALGSYNGGTLFLTENSGEFLTETFDANVDVTANGSPYLKITFITAVDAIMYISEFAVESYPAWKAMPVDVERGTDDVDENGNFKSVFGRADVDFYFYPEVIQDCMAGDRVTVTLQYKIVSEAPMADSRGALGSYNGGTLFLTANSENFLSVTFETIIGEDAKGVPCLKLVFITAVDATMYIKEFSVEAELEKAYGLVCREADLGLGGNILYFLPSTTGMQTLSMIVQNTAGEIYIIDGGFDSTIWGGNDAKLIYDIVSELSGENDKVIKGWFFTHPHNDHFGFFADFIKNYGSEVTIDTIYYSWSEDASWYKQYTETPDVDINLVTAFKNAIPADTNVVEPKTGDLFNFGSFSFKILYSPANNNYPFTGNEAYNFNNLSLVIKMTTAEKSILFLGDAGVGAGEWLLENCTAEDLKADVVQMAHHGQAGVNQAVYQAIDPDVALWNCDEAVYNNASGRLQTLVVRGWMEELGTTNYISKDGIYIFN